MNGAQPKKTFDVVMFNMSSFSEWTEQGRVNRNFHVLNNLLKNPRIRKVLAVDFLPFTPKRAARNYWENILGKLQVESYKLKVMNIYRDLTSKCVQINSQLTTHNSQLYVYSTIDSVFSEKAAIKKIQKLIKTLEFNNIVVWSYFPMFVGCFDSTNAHESTKNTCESRIKSNNLLGAKLTVFDTVDNWIEHPNFAKYQERLKKNYSTISQKADLIFTVSGNLVEFYETLGREKGVYWIPNGIDIGHFSSSGGSAAGGQCQNPKFKDIQHPIVGYLGVIQSRIDMELIKYLAEKNPDKSFILAGPVWPDAKKELVENLPNVYFPGRIPYQEAPSCLYQFDVGIIPHIINDFTLSMNPLKLYEYLACGKPVVTTPVAGTEAFKNLIYVAENYEEFNQKINQALKEDNEDLRQKRREAVKEHSWEKRIGEMLRLISGKIE